MNKTKKTLTNRCFGGNSSKPPKQQPNDKQKRKEQKIKEVLSSVAQRNKANKEIDCLLKQFHGKRRIIDLLLVIELRFSRNVLTVALETAERIHHEDAIFLAEFRAKLEKSE